MRNKFLRNPLHIVKDYELRKLLWQSGGGTAVCKKYLKFRDIAPEKLTFPETKVDEPIWLFWNTGLEKAPEIVRTCYQSVKKICRQTSCFAYRKQCAELYKYAGLSE